MKQYKLLNNLLGWVVFVIAAVTYILTLEPTASFWDCGEFISSAYKFEVGHPPGNPVFMLTGRFFANFASDPSHVAYMINLMSALLSAGTILFLFWTITRLARKIIVKAGEEISLAQTITVLACGAVGALAYTWSDTFWFSAVEGEVYAYSSFCTALVFWLILKWEDVADEPHSDRYIVLIAYIIGISIAVHLLNLLTIPALVLVYYFRKFNNPTVKGSIVALLLSFAGIVFLLYGLVPGFVKVAGWAELLCVNGMGMPFNTGVVLYFILVIACIVWGLYETYQRQNETRLRLSFLISVILVGLPFISSKIWVGILISTALAIYLFYNKKLSVRLLNMVLVSILVIFIGYSSYAIIVIRSSANTPMDQNSPEDVFALGSYLNREQYGDRPLLYGQTFVAEISRDANGVPRSVEGAAIWAKKIKESPNEHDRYEIIDHKQNYIYIPELCTFFPRMYSSESNHVQAYKEWSGYKGKQVRVNGRLYRKPTFGENLKFFFDYQVNFMYWRYFMWNFVGRQNDIQGNGDVAYGNWITGFDFIDNQLVGDQSLLPTELKENKGHNVFYMLPLLLGILGLLLQLYSGKKGIESFWVVFFFFFMTGLAIVIYLNQTPYQPRERDYAYAGSFYAFSIWIGLGTAAIYKFLSRQINPVVSASIAAVVSLVVPLQMVGQTWDDHDRSGRYTCRDFGKNYLSSVDENGIIFTNGDNDTFPLWYAQETEGYRTDVRVCNLSYLQTDWYVNQMKSQAYESAPLPISMKESQYGNKKREYAYVFDRVDYPVSVRAAMNYFLSDNENTKRVPGYGNINHLPTGNLYISIDKDAAAASGIVPEDYLNDIVDTMNLPISKNILLLNDLSVLDMLATNAEEGWKRPIYFATTVDPNMFIETDKYFMRTGMAYKIVPVNLDNERNDYAIDTDKMYDNVMNKFVWGGIDTIPDIYLDETIRRMCYSYRIMFTDLTNQLLKENKVEKAAKALDYCMKKIPETAVRHNYMSLQLALNYYNVNQPEKGKELMKKIADNALEYITWINSLDNDKKRSIQREYVYNERVLMEQIIPSLYKTGEEQMANEYFQAAVAAGVNANKYYKR